nr:Type 1 glutamine amidotransferase-like domain-containing protein [Galbitalea soli]
MGECAARAAGAGRVVPRVAVLLVAENAPDGADAAAKYRAMLGSIAVCEPVVTVILEGNTASSAVLNDIDGLLIGGGLTPAYVVAVRGLFDEIRLLVHDGLPYLGFSAGAAIAADVALIGGWLIGDVPVCHENTSEDLDEVTVAQGIGLVDMAIDVHAAQWGTVGRLIAATEAELVEGGVAIDENTVLIVKDDGVHVEGVGSVWRVTPGEDGVVVSIVGAEAA